MFATIPRFILFSIFPQQVVPSFFSNQFLVPHLGTEPASFGDPAVTGSPISKVFTLLGVFSLPHLRHYFYLAVYELCCVFLLPLPDHSQCSLVGRGVFLVTFLYWARGVLLMNILHPARGRVILVGTCFTGF